MKAQKTVQPAWVVKRTRRVLGQALRDAKKSIKFCTHQYSRLYVQIPQDEHDDLGLNDGNTRVCLDCHKVFERVLV